MRFQPDFLDDLRMRLSLADYIGRRVRLTRKGREHSGLCPFHNEKTPSFTVNEEKGFYHCFGCGAHGDIIKFSMETESLSFPEAVEKLADEAGLALPVQSDFDRKETAKRIELHDVMEAATQWYESQLQSSAGQQARDYLRDRGLKAETIADFRIGVAMRGRTHLRDALLARKFTEQQLIDTGLVIKPEDGGQTYDRFRDRVMFPITDARNKIVAFGGRALGDAKAKYLNSPETSLFHKGHLLYNLPKAREASRPKDRMIVVEGYMDVIAITQSGFGECVAPLGTALTEQQILQLWRLTPEPILCFDGDNAGVRASERAMERVLPLLKPAHSLRFAYLPKGEDPDSLVNTAGPGAFENILGDAKSLIDVLWETTLAQGPVDTPERRAGFRSRLIDMAKTVGDDDVRRFYLDDLGDRFKQMGRSGIAGSPAPQRGGQNGRNRQGKGGWKDGGRGNRFEPAVSPELLRTNLAQKTSSMAPRREKLLIRVILNHPALLENLEEDLMNIAFSSAELDKMHAAIIGIAVECRANSVDLESSTLKNHLMERGFSEELARLEADRSLISDGFASADSPLETAAQGIAELIEANQLDMLRTDLQQAELDAAERLEDVDVERAALRIRKLREQIEVLSQRIAEAGDVAV
jgi:DNA primase